MDIHEFLSKLSGVKKAGVNWQARCPAHDDRQASLGVSTGDDGRILIKCFAGCTAKSVVESLGLTLKDLFPAPKVGGGGVLSSPFRSAHPHSKR